MSLLGLFGRKVAVEFGPSGGVGRRLDGLRVGFKVEFKAAKTPPTASIRIFNPAPDSIAAMRLPTAVVRLFVGYDPLPKLLFEGAPVKGGVDVKVEGGDRVLEVDAADGGPGFQQFVSLSFATATTYGQVLAAVLAQTQWARGLIMLPEAQALPHGVALIGRPADILDSLMGAVPYPGAEWFVRDNALYVVTRGASTPEVAPLLSSAQGNLIGSPTYAKAGELKCRALIDATMRPGRAFVVQSIGVVGSFVAKDITFQGDSGWERDFYMDITAKPLGAP